MAIPKKKRRTITIDDVEYHWVIGNRSDHRLPRATVQESTGAGAKLHIDPVGILKPSDIAAAIRFALVHGWNPRSSGPDTYLGFVEDMKAGPFVARNANAQPFWKERLGEETNTGQSQSPAKPGQPAADGLA
jgi:hypothetical protein